MGNLQEKGKSARALDFILIGVIAGLSALLDVVGVVGLPTGVFSVSSLYLGGAFFTCFAIWFRYDGLIGIYLGLLLGAIFAGTFTVFAFFLALGNVICALLISLVFRFVCHGKLKRVIDYIFFIAAVFVCNIIGGLYTLGLMTLLGLVPSDALFIGVVSWVIGALIVNIVLAIPMLKIFTPILSSKNLVKL